MKAERIGYYILLVGVAILAVLGLGGVLFASVYSVLWYFRHGGLLVGSLFLAAVLGMVLFVVGLLVMLWAEKS